MNCSDIEPSTQDESPNPAAEAIRGTRRYERPELKRHGSLVDLVQQLPSPPPPPGMSAGRPRGGV